MINILAIGFFLLLVWLIILSIFYWQMYSHYNTIIRSGAGHGLKEIMETLLQEREANKRTISQLSEKYDRIEKDGKFHIQKIGLVRFNPFKDTGGDQSFILSLVDAENSGVIISGLYSRSGTRWYAKKVKEGRGVDHELSQEEMKALHGSRKITNE